MLSQITDQQNVLLTRNTKDLPAVKLLESLKDIQREADFLGVLRHDDCLSKKRQKRFYA